VREFWCGLLRSKKSVSGALAELPADFAVLRVSVWSAVRAGRIFFFFPETICSKTGSAFPTRCGTDGWIMARGVNIGSVPPRIGAETAARRGALNNNGKPAIGLEGADTTTGAIAREAMGAA